MNPIIISSDDFPSSDDMIEVGLNDLQVFL